MGVGVDKVWLTPKVLKKNDYSKQEVMLAVV
jgi:hypothetical protein